MSGRASVDVSQGGWGSCSLLPARDAHPCASQVKCQCKTQDLQARQHLYGDAKRKLAGCSVSAQLRATCPIVPRETLLLVPAAALSPSTLPPIPTAPDLRTPASSLAFPHASCPASSRDLLRVLASRWSRAGTCRQGKAPSQRTTVIGFLRMASTKYTSPESAITAPGLIGAYA